MKCFFTPMTSNGQTLNRNIFSKFIDLESLCIRIQSYRLSFIFSFYIIIEGSYFTDHSMCDNVYECNSAGLKCDLFIWLCVAFLHSAWYHDDINHISIIPFQKNIPEWSVKILEWFLGSFIPCIYWSEKYDHYFK